MLPSLTPSAPLSLPFLLLLLGGGGAAACSPTASPPTSAEGAPGDLRPPAAPDEAVVVSPAPVPSEGGAAAVSPLEGLRGRRVWMVNASAEACATATGLGLVVDCEASRPGAARAEVVSWCPEVSRASLEALRTALGVESFVVRSWEDQPEERDAEECGAFAEVTVRY